MTSLFITAGMVVIGFILFFIYSPSGKAAITALWEHLPTKEEYIKLHPRLLDGENIRCYHCGSSDTLDTGLACFTDYRRTIICRSCKHRLWREQD